MIDLHIKAGGEIEKRIVWMRKGPCRCTTGRTCFDNPSCTRYLENEELEDHDRKIKTDYFWHAVELKRRVS